MRAHVTRLIEMLAPLGVDLALTTNGVKLAEVAHDLQHAGPHPGERLARHAATRPLPRADACRDDLDRVIAGIDAALDAGLAPVKVNAVVIRGVNDDEIVDLARFGRDRGVGMRFIEFMPLDAQGAWSEAQVVPAREIVERIAAEFPVEPSATAAHVEPATRWRYVDGRGDVGVIPSVTEPFCESCDRVRITAEGQFRTCLFALDEIDLRAELRADGGLDAPDLDDRLAAAIERAVGGQVGGAPHRPGRFRPPRPLDVADRRLNRPRGVSGQSGREASGPEHQRFLRRFAAR